MFCVYSVGGGLSIRDNSELPRNLLVSDDSILVFEDAYMRSDEVISPPSWTSDARSGHL